MLAAAATAAVAALFFMYSRAYRRRCAGVDEADENGDTEEDRALARELPIFADADMLSARLSTNMTLGTAEKEEDPRRLTTRMLMAIRHRASSPVLPKSNFLSSPPRKLQSSAFSSPLQLAQSSPSLSRSTSTAVVHHQIGDRVGKNLSVRFPPPSAPPLKVPPKQSRCSSDSTYKSYAPRARLAIIPTNKKRSAARLPASEWTPAVPTWLEARRKQFATKLALKQRSAAQKEAANLLLRQSFEVGSPLRRPIVVRSGSPLPLISTTGGLRCTHDAAVQSRLPGSIFIPITV